MTITVTDQTKNAILDGLTDFLTADRSGMRFDAMRIEDVEKEGAVRVIFSLGGKDMFSYSAHGCRLSGGVISLSGIDGAVPFELHST